MLKKIIPVILSLQFILAMLSCKSTSTDIDLLLSFMTGSFSSQEQAQADTNFKDIRLEMVPIWDKQSDGFWLYVEQAAAGKLDMPYRQRVYHVAQLSDSTIESTVYTIPNPKRFVGEWKKEKPLISLTPDSLISREGCAVILTKQVGNIFVGATESLNCDSDLFGATFATSIVMITENQIYSWDRGFDIKGNQVWGSKAGGYIFKKSK